MKQRKNGIILFVLLLSSVNLFAVPACPDSVQVKQSDGTMLWTRVHGDEFYHWRSTTDGNVILRDEQKCYRYAIVEGDSLVPSKIMVHNLQDRTADEKEFINNNTEIVLNLIRQKQQIALERKQTEFNSYLKNSETSVAMHTTAAVTGKRKILTILVGFKDRPFTKTAVDFDRLMNLENGKVEDNCGSVRKFYQEDSYGKLDVSSIVIGPFTAKRESSYYEYKDTSKEPYNVIKLVEEAIGYAQKRIDFSTLDGDGDGYVDCIHVVFAGHGVSGGASDGLIWEHMYQLPFTTKLDGKKIALYIVTPELGVGNAIAPIGTICHEFSHILGVPDFYDRENDVFSATGNYDLMCRGSWNSNGCYPAHNNAYSKCYLLGWANPTLISSEHREYKMQSSTHNPIFYRVNTQTDGEFFLLENRVRDTLTCDRYIPYNGGLLIYHIHKDLAATIAKHEFINVRHPLMCYIVNSAAKTNPTNAPYSYGNDIISRSFPTAYNNKTSFTISSTPSFTAWNGVGTGVNLCFIKQNPDRSISFTVNPQIEGPDHLCGERTYSVTGIVPDKDTIVWSYVSNIEFIRAFPVLKFPNGRQGASVSVVRGAQFVRLVDSIGDRLPDSPIIMSMAETQSSGQSVWAPYTGTVTLAATVHSGNGTYRIEKEIELPKNKAPELDIPFAQKPMWFANQTRTFTEKGNPNIEGAYIKWYVKYPQDTVFTEYTGRSVSLTPTKAGTITIRVVNDCGCPTRNETTYTFDILSTMRPPSIRFSYPNPVGTSTLPIVVEQDHSGESDIAVQSIADNLPEYTIELWSDILGRVRTITSNDPYVELDITGLPAGWYQLLLLQDGQLIDSGKVLIGQ